MPGAEASRTRKPLRILLWIAYNLGATFAILVAINWWHVRHLKRRPWVPLEEISRDSGLPLDLVQAIGSYHSDGPVRRDLRALPHHRAGVIRIGAFGDSFTFGDEVQAAGSFPAQLQELFGLEGFSNVEVINFGNSFHGFGQATRLWEEFGKKYNLDFVLLGPACLYRDRDLTFSHTGNSDPDYIHGRYVLEGDGAGSVVRWIDPLGGSDQHARYRMHNRFFTPWTYLRYDRAPPALLRALLPAGRTVANPAYYTKLSLRAEGDRLYAALLSRWASGRSQVLMVHHELDIVRLADPVRSKMVAVHLAEPLDEFPKRRMRGHFSGAGNRVIAGIYRDLTMGRRPVAFEVINTHSPTVPAPDTHRPLTDFTRADVLFGDRLVGTFQYAQTDLRHLQERLVDFRVASVAAVLALGGDSSFLDKMGVMRGEPLHAGAELAARLDTARGERHISLGKVTLLDEGGLFGQVSHPALEPEYLGRLALHSHRVGIPREEVRGGELSLDGQPILIVGHDEGAPVLHPMSGELLVVRPQHDTRLESERLPASGDVRIILRGSRPLSLPAGTFSKVRRELPWDDAGLHRRIQRSATDPTRAEVARQ